MFSGESLPAKDGRAGAGRHQHLRRLQGLRLSRGHPELPALREPGHAQGIHQEVRDAGPQQEPYQTGVVIFIM